MPTLRQVEILHGLSFSFLNDLGKIKQPFHVAALIKAKVCKLAVYHLKFQSVSGSWGFFPFQNPPTLYTWSI